MAELSQYTNTKYRQIKISLKIYKYKIQINFVNVLNFLQWDYIIFCIILQSYKKSKNASINAQLQPNIMIM